MTTKNKNTQHNDYHQQRRSSPSRMKTIYLMLLMTLLSHSSTAQTDNPTEVSSGQPSMIPSSSPSKNLIPTANPTTLPTVSPTITPSALPTPFPTLAPTPFPTFSPTISPTITMHPSPTGPIASPTANPTWPPTLPPTPFPTFAPTTTPLTGFPTPSPMFSPTPIPTEFPTKVPTEVPTLAPSPTTGGTTDEPSSAQPTTGFVSSVKQEGLIISLTGAQFLGASGLAGFQAQTKQYIEDFYNLDEEQDVDLVKDVFGVNVVITITDQNQNPTLRRRNLQEGNPLDITFTQLVDYRTISTTAIPINDIVETPFSNIARRNNYIENYLKKAPGTDAFAGVTKVSTIIIAVAPPEEGLDTTLIIIIAAVLAVAAALIVVVVCLCFCRGDGKDGSGGGSSGNKENKTPPNRLSLGSYDGSSEVSTLAEPQGKLGVMTSNESLAGYGDQSVATVDYDYSKAYAGGGDTSVSSAGGTFGSNTHGGSTALTGLSATNQSVFSDDASFEAHFRDSGRGGNTREVEIPVFAPPGKLGVVIDTPDDGAPVVHAIKDSSPIADKLRVGDKLVAVDDEDVRSMTAIKVSKLISRKSANAQRKLTVIRSAIAE
mmetsp:Transcript_1193/g.1748  ORF Transcript_1193/g.1748 Transcript_1193/m.1748 type:complete len:600 (+) Transcript_1193:108-1907(+)